MGLFIQLVIRSKIEKSQFSLWLSVSALFSKCYIFPCYYKMSLFLHIKFYSGLFLDGPQIYFHFTTTFLLQIYTCFDILLYIPLSFGIFLVFFSLLFFHTSCEHQPEQFIIKKPVFIFPEIIYIYKLTIGLSTREQVIPFNLMRRGEVFPLVFSVAA